MNACNMSGYYITLFTKKQVYTICAHHTYLYIEAHDVVFIFLFFLSLFSFELFLTRHGKYSIILSCCLCWCSTGAVQLIRNQQVVSSNLTTSSNICRRSSVVELQLPKLTMRVRFPSLAPVESLDTQTRSWGSSCFISSCKLTGLSTPTKQG